MFYILNNILFHIVNLLIDHLCYKSSDPSIRDDFYMNRTSHTCIDVVLAGQANVTDIETHCCPAKHIEFMG